jgi:hypothetical protein
VPTLNMIRTVTVKMATEGADRARTDLDSVANADERRAKAATATANVVEQSVKRQLSATAALDREMKRIDAQYGARRSLERASSTIDRAASQGIIDQAERARLTDLATTRYAPNGGNDNDPTRKGLSTYDKQFIRYQGFDVASSLGSGASPLTVAAQQGPQVLQQLADRDGGLKAGLKDLGTSALGLITPLTLAGTAVAALGAGFAYAAVQAGRDQDVLQKATQGIGVTTGATVSALNALAVSNASAGKVSTSTAREIVAGYASLGTIAVPVIGDLTRVTSEYARVTGQEVPAATAELGRMFADPARGAEDLAAKIGGLDDRTRELIRTQIEQGDRSTAQQTLADSLKASIDANAVATTGWAAAWNTATAAADSYWNAAKRIAGIKLGIVPEGAAEAAARLTTAVENTNRTRGAIGLDPLNGKDSELVRQQATARVIADQERMIAKGKAAEERARQASAAAGTIARSYDPQAARLSELRTQQGTLRDALADPLARSKLADQSETESAYAAATRAIDSMTDSTGKLVAAQEMARRGDQLRMDALKAGTDAEKAAVAERQKAFDLVGKTITNTDARSQIEMAGKLSLAGASSKGGGSKGGASDASDDFDRATKSIEDRIRRQEQEAKTFGMGAEATARYRTETDLLVASKRAERDITPALTATIQDYADKAAAAAKQQEALRESMREMDGIRATGRDVFGGVFNDISKGTSAANVFTNALGKIQSKMLDLASSSLTDALFGKSGSSSMGLLGNLFGGSTNSVASGGVIGENGGFGEVLA